RLRSDSTSSSVSQGSRSKTILRQRLAELMTCIEDMSSDDEAGEEVSRTLDEAFQLCGRLLPTDAFLHMVTWNVATAEPPEDVASLLQLNDQPAIDLYVILQEVNVTPVRFISDLMAEDSWSHLFMDTLGPKGFVTSVRMQGLLLLVFAKMMHLPFIRNIQTTYTRTGIFGYWQGNKGAVSVRFSFYGHMMCFLNCHLAAHMHNALQRVDEFEYILETQDFDIFDTPHVLDHVVFWFGDLNFRIEDHGLHFVRSSINGGRLNLLWSKDQMMKKKEPFLQEFDEGPLNFKPTYKFDRKADSYDTGKKRKPAWTDRILWRIKPKSLPSEEDDDDDEKASTSADDGQEEYPIMVTQNTYTSVMSYGVSDHKPVIGNFTLELRKYFDTQLVDLAPAGEWSADHDALLTYTILEDFMSSTWDWIGLYKVGFKSASNYETFVWVRENELPEVNEVIELQKSVAKDDLPLLSGEYVLGYYSTNLNSIVGLSDNFQILESKRAAMEDLVSKDINGIDK
uniref:Inositol polyphosphate-5-phosphatase K n=1 Tax=Poecilia latipinna TaxID=48699 RepID=A0A3B3ULG8_9TELE